MTSLALHLLGTFRVHLDQKPVTTFETNKGRALLAYLAVDQRSHARLRLAGLFWPDWPEAAARTYLRQALLNLRQCLTQPATDPPYLLTSRHTIQFNQESDHWLDVAEVGGALARLPQQPGSDPAPATLQRLEEAVALYEGDFLDGFYLDGCPAFEEWQLLTREQLRRGVVEAICYLAGWHERQGNLTRAERYARRSLELDPLLEESHLQLLRLLALSGDRNAALAHYERYRRQLSAELEAAPSWGITALYERIKAGSFPAAAAARQPRGRAGAAADPGAQPSSPPLVPYLPAAPEIEPLCLARERELTLLHGHLNRAVDRQGGVVFITGEAGQGKTTLVRAFAAQAESSHGQLVAVGGACSSHDGIGDVLLPFREILAQITGDFDAQRAAGTIGTERAGRLWSMFPEAVEALLTFGPDLANTLIPGKGLAARVSLLADERAWRGQLEALTRGRAPVANARGLFDQFTRVLQALAGRHPLLLWIDDLHWADRASSALLFHLGQRLAGYPILLVGTYRPEEVAAGSDGERHPLDKVLRELQARHGAARIDLDQCDGRPLIDAYLDLERNRLDAVFRDRLYRLSGGHPLFTVELVRTMRERQGLVQDPAGDWVEGPALDWDRLPSRLEAVIGERVDRLPAAEQAVLGVAAVEGDEFTAEVVADVLGSGVPAVISQLSSGLSRHHRLVAAVDTQSVGSGHLSRYRFRHILFQKYLYNGLDAAERRQLHEAVAASLQARLRDDPEQLAAAAGQIANHLAQAGLAEQAIRFACLAGERALQMSANEEAAAYYRWGLALLSRLPNAGQHQTLEVDLQLGVGTALAMADRHAALPVREALARAAHLCRDLNDLPRLFRALWGLWRFYLVRGEARASLALAEECMAIAQQMADASLILQADESLGTSLSRTGKMMPALERLAHGTQLYDAQRHRRHALLYAQDPGVSLPANEAQVLWYLGYADQARARMRAALDCAARHEHTASIAYAYIFAAGLYQRAGDSEKTLAWAERTIEYSRSHGFAQWVAVGALYRGWAIFTGGEQRQGLAEMREGYEATLQTRVIQLRYTTLLAEVSGLAGEVDDSLAAVGQLIQTAHRLGELEWAAEMYRVQGTLQALTGSPAAVASFQRAIALAQAQRARSLELRATLGLTRLWLQMGRVGEARRQLSEIYNWFTEGFDLPDLVSARSLLAASGT